MKIDIPTVKEYVSIKFKMEGDAAVSFALALWLCFVNRNYLLPGGERALFAAMEEWLRENGGRQYLPGLKSHLRYGINRTWRKCRNRPRGETCPITVMELVRRGVDILDWAQKSPQDMVGKDARRILWRDNGTVERYPEFVWPKTLMPEIMRILYDAPLEFVAHEDLVRIAGRAKGFTRDDAESAIFMLRLKGIINEYTDAEKAPGKKYYQAAWTRERYQNETRKKFIRYYEPQTREERIARDALLPRDVQLDDKSVQYLGKILRLFQNL